VGITKPRNQVIKVTKYNRIALLIGPPAFLLSVATGQWVYFILAAPIVIALSVLDKKEISSNEEEKNNNR
jgi:hypothetical protein